jgi:hypothetical protein
MKQLAADSRKQDLPEPIEDLPQSSRVELGRIRQTRLEILVILVQTGVDGLVRPEVAALFSRASLELGHLLGEDGEDVGFFLSRGSARVHREKKQGRGKRGSSKAWRDHECARNERRKWQTVRDSEWNAVHTHYSVVHV